MEWGFETLRAHQMQFTDEELEIIKEVFSDWGSDCPSADYAKVKLLGVKLGVWEEEKPPTEEELKRREAYANSPEGIMMINLFKHTNLFFEKIAKEELMKDVEFWKNPTA